MIKKIAKTVLPAGAYKTLKYLKVRREVGAAYKYDMKRYLTYSDLTGDTPTKMMGKIIKEYHVVEKGLTMPETRYGFGKALLIGLSKDCIAYIKLYGKNEEQLIHAIEVILEYENFHRIHGFKLDDDVLTAINNLKQYADGVSFCSQKETSRDEYFKHTESAFAEFSRSRSSVRNYSEQDIPLETMKEVLDIARNTPSACNRQCSRTYLYTDKEKIKRILDAQGGNRGFGHLSNKIIIITAEVGVFTGVQERNEAFIDGGMYAMNLLYALHYKHIAGCILNCSHDVEKDRRLRALCKIKESEVFIAMISCGIPPENFKIATSKRYDLSRTNTIVEN